MTLTIAFAQLNPTVGDVAGNTTLVRRTRDDAAAQGADLVVFSELVLVGYPPEDLVLRPALVEAAADALRDLQRESAAPGMPGIVVTLPWKEGGRVRNTAALVANGRVDLRFKHELPNYGVFDEKRVFEPGPLPEPVMFRDATIGMPICEDIWLDHVTAHLAASGVQLMLVPNGSPFEVDKFEHRLELARARATAAGVPLAYINQVGGQDELVFDGGSFVINADGSLACVMPFWREALTLTRWTSDGPAGPKGPALLPGPEGRAPTPGAKGPALRPGAKGPALRCQETAHWSPQPRLDAIYNAMVLGLRDYARKNRFPGVVLGMSGGIDSALTAAVAVDALGAAHVRGVRLPSRFTSKASLDDAEESARMLGMRLDTVPIESPVAATEATLAPLFEGRPRDVAEENLQARIRGVVLMALSNKFGDLLVTTGNKSEMSVGYATLYGDMCGGYSVLKDIYKTEVYALAHWRNEHVVDGGCGPRGRVIPESSITKAPTAELRPNQTDQDSLPPYEELDAILRGLVEEELSVAQIVARGFARETVTRVQRLLYSAEYKRRQAPPGVKITRKSFGRDRRYPLTNAFRE
jgi:NAD+ synthase